MSIWMWLLIFVILTAGIAAANVGQKRNSKGNMQVLFWFVTAVVLFFVWWFTR